MTLPNVLTLLRIFLSMWMGYVAVHGNTYGAFVIFLGACISDVADGFIARRFDMISSFGKLIDPLADKLMLAVGIGILVYIGVLNKVFLYALVLEELVLILGSIYMLGKGIVVYSSKYGKTASLFFTVGIGSGLLGFSHIAVGLLTGGLCCGLFAACYYIIYFIN